MAIYVIPQSHVFQDYSMVAALVARPLRAHIAGGQAQLVRFGQSAEQANGFLDFYDPLLANTYAWPNQAAASVVDQGYTKLWTKNALLQYFATQIGGGHLITKVAGYGNRIQSSNLNFATNGTAYPRDAAFNDRDVQVGDIVKVRGIDTNATPQTLWTSVKSLLGVPTAASVAAATSDAANAATQSASVSVSKVAGVLNGVVVTPNGAAYNGLAAGAINETYDILVTVGSISGNDTVASLRVISGSGTDDQDSVTPAARGTAFAIGTRGLKITLSDDDLASSSKSASAAGIPVDLLVVGHRWRITVHEAFTKPTPTSGGTYTGSANTTYIVGVSRGGNFTDAIKPQINVTTANGIDISGPTTVSAANTAVAVGTLGVTIKFAGTQLRKGDVYYIPATGAGSGPMRVLELNSGLATTIADGTELDLTLYINHPSLQIAQNREGAAPLQNWTQDASGITVNSGITVLDPTWTKAGVPQPIPLVSDGVNYSGMYVEYRAWLPGLANNVVGTISSSANLNAAISGPTDPDNPLKFGVALALANANGSEVKYTAIADPSDLTQWQEMLNAVGEQNDMYGLVPLTRDPNVLAAYGLHVLTYSTPEESSWRVAWFSLLAVPEIPLVSAGSDVLGHTQATTTDGQPCLCTITADPHVTGTVYTILRCTSANSNFLSNHVQAGDVVRIGYTGDGFGNFTYTEYVVDSVTSETSLHLLVGPAQAISQPVKTEVWHNMSADDEARDLALQASAWGSKRVRAVWPDQVEVNGVAVDGVYLCAALAGLVSATLPHQSLTHVQIAGFSSALRSTPKFTATQLDTMTHGGVWVVTQDRVSLALYTRQGVTTVPYNDLNNREEMIVRNVDSISFRYEEWLSPFIGGANVTPLVVGRIGTEVTNLTGLLKTEAQTDMLGGQLLEATVTDLRQHTTLLDHIILNITVTVPMAVNAIDLTLTI